MAKKVVVARNPTGDTDVAFSELLEDYRLSLEALNRSPKTISWYLDILERYFDFLHSNFQPESVQELGARELRLYILSLQRADRWANNGHMKQPKGKLSPFSVQGHVRAIKAFWSWLENEEYISNNPLSKFSLPKVPDKPVNVLNGEQIKGLLAGINRLTPKGARYYLILLLFLDTGIRISELAHIRIKDVDLSHNYLQVLGKGQKQRWLPISKITTKEISRYIHHFRLQISPVQSPYLFTTPEGEPITINSVQQFLRRLAAKAGLTSVKISPHIFRHTFATQSIANGANVFVLKEIMGHSSLQTTMKYTHLQPQDLQIQHAKFSPVGNLGIGRPTRRDMS